VTPPSYSKYDVTRIEAEWARWQNLYERDATENRPTLPGEPSGRDSRRLRAVLAFAYGLGIGALLVWAAIVVSGRLA